MRKTLEIIALCLVLLAWAVTANAVLGRNPLPARIPTHFGATGAPNGWGTPAMLWLIPSMSTVIYLLMSLVARYPSAIHFPMRSTPFLRRQLEAIALNMISWLKAELVSLFAWIQYESVQFARREQGTLSPVFLPLVLVAVFGTIAVHIAAMRRAAGAHQGE